MAIETIEKEYHGIPYTVFLTYDGLTDTWKARAKIAETILYEPQSGTGDSEKTYRSKKGAIEVADGLARQHIAFQSQRTAEMTPADPVPGWLANDVNPDNAKFDEGGKTVTGQPNAHLRAVLDVGNGAPPFVTVKLTKAQLNG